MMTSRAKAQIHQDLARRIKALGGDVGDVEAITHDDRSFLMLLGAIVDRLEALTAKQKV